MRYPKYDRCGIQRLPAGCFDEFAVSCLDRISLSCSRILSVTASRLFRENYSATRASSPRFFRRGNRIFFCLIAAPTEASRGESMPGSKRLTAIAIRRKSTAVKPHAVSSCSKSPCRIRSIWASKIEERASPLHDLRVTELNPLPFSSSPSFVAGCVLPCSHSCGTQVGHMLRGGRLVLSRVSETPCDPAIGLSKYAHVTSLLIVGLETTMLCFLQPRIDLFPVTR